MTDEEITDYLRAAGVVEAVLPFSDGSMRILKRFTEAVIKKEREGGKAEISKVLPTCAGMSRMKIYHIGWVQNDSFGLSAVVIAESEEAALAELDLDIKYNGEVRVSLIGVCSDGTEKAIIVCQDSL